MFDICLWVLSSPLSASPLSSWSCCTCAAKTIILCVDNKDALLLQVWHAPGKQKDASLMALHRTYGGCHGAILALDWSPCSQFIAVASKDLTAR